MTRAKYAQSINTSPYWKSLRARRRYEPAREKCSQSTIAISKGGVSCAGSGNASIPQPSSAPEASPGVLLRRWLEGGEAWRADATLARDLAAFALLIRPFPQGCWFFRSADDLFDYATFIRPSSGARVTAHLWLYRLLHGSESVPRGMVVDHTCETKRCVNPRHLEAVTVAVNVQRSIDRKKARESRGEDP